MLQFSACFHQRSCHPIDWLAAWIFSGQDPKALLWAKVNPTNPSHTSRCLHLSLKNLPLHLSLFQKAGKCRNGLESECGISFSLMSTFFVFYTHILTWNIIFKISWQMGMVSCAILQRASDWHSPIVGAHDSCPTTIPNTRCSSDAIPQAHEKPLKVRGQWVCDIRGCHGSWEEQHRHADPTLCS